MPQTGSHCDAAVMDHLLLLRMLTLSSRRTAELEARAATSTVRSGGAAANDLTVDEKLSSTTLPETRPHTHVGVGGGHAEKSAVDAGGAEDGTIVMGTVLLSGQAERGASEYAEGDAHTPRRQASSAAEVSHGSLGVRAAASHFDSDTTGLCVAAAGRNADEPATPLTPMSPMSPVSAARRALEKGARPVRRPRASPANASISATSPSATTAHARSCSTGSGNGAALDAATSAKRREVVRRTLSSLGLPTSAISPARAAAATADAGGAAQTTAEAKSSLIDDNTTTTSAAAAPTLAPATAAGAGAASSPSPAASTREESDAASSGSPTVAHTFSTFLQLLRPAPPTPSLTPVVVGAASASLPVSKTNRITTTLPTADTNASLTTPLMPPAPPVPLLSSVADSALHSTTSSFAPTALAAAAAAGAGAVTVLPLPPPPPPPYSEAAAPQITPGAGTFHSAQELLAHVRLQLRWTVVTAQQRRRCRADGGADATEEPPAKSPVSSSSLPLPSGPATAGAAQAEAITSPTLSCASSSNPLRVPAALTAPAAATASGASSLPEEVTLVSDRVDAVLPTWAYLSSHIADAAPPAFVLAVAPPTTAASAPALSRGDSMTLGATGSAPQSRHRRTLSHASSVASSVAPMASPAMLPTPITTTCVTEEQGVDRQACLFPDTLAEACALARLRQQARPGTAPCSSLHLLRLELLVEVQHIPPTVLNVTPAERQAQMEQALEEFAQTGVLPTTVLRGVLNDAALRLLASVDDGVLHRVADEHRQREWPNAKGGVVADSSEPSRHAVVPLSVQVRTLQGDAAVAPGPQRPPPLSNASIHSATASIASGDTDSLRHPSLASAALMTTPVKLTITMLVHVLPALREDAAEERTEVVAARETASEPIARSRSTASSPDAGDGDDAVGAANARATAPHMEEATAISLACVVVPHLFPLNFSLSRYTTRLSLSTAVNYDVLRGLAGGSSGAAESGEEAAKRTCSARQDGSFAAAMDAPASAVAAAGGGGGGGGSQPWAWQELSIPAVREACGVPERRPLPTPSFAATPAGGLSRLVRVMAPSSLAAVVAGGGSIGAANGLASLGSSLASQPTLASRRSRKRLTAPASPSAAVTPAAADSATTNTTTTATDAAVVEDAQAPCAVEPATVRSAGGVAMDAAMGAPVNAEGVAQTAADSPAASEGGLVTVAPMSADAARPADEPDTHEVRCEILLKEQPVLVPDSATAAASLHAAEEEGDEFDEGGAISESLRRWDVAKETAELTAVAEAVHAKVDAMCGHAGLLRALMEAVESGILEASTPSAEGVSESRRGDGGAGRRGRGTATIAVGCTPPRTDGQTADSTPGAYRRNAAVAAQRVLLYSMSHLVRTGLLCDDSGSPPSLLAGLLATEEESAGATKPMPRVGTTAAAAAAEHTNGVARQLPLWFSRYAAVLAERVCAPLEQLETYISETTSSAVTTPRPLMAASVSVEDGTASNTCANGGGGVGGAVGYGTAADEGSGGRRVVVGAQVVVKESRRQRRQAAAAARCGAVADLVQAPQRDVEDHDPEPESGTDTSMLPVLCIAKAAVQRCRMMGDTSAAAAAAAVSVSQAPAASPSATAAVGHDGEESQEQTPTTSTASLAGLALHIHPPPHYRSVSSSSFTSMRVAHAAATAAALHPLQERVAPLLEVMRVVLRQLDAEEQRWAALQVALTCLRTAWGARLELLNKEGLQRGTLTCAALMRQEGIGRRAVRTAEASAVAKLRDAKRADALAQAAAAVSRVGACAEQAAAATATLAGVAPSSMPDLSEADTVPDFATSPPPPLSSAAPAAARALAEVCKATAAGEEALLSPSPPTPSDASGSDEDEVDGEEGAGEGDARSSVAATETSTTAARARRHGAAGVDTPSTPAAATRNGHTSYATATGQRAAPQRTAGSQHGARGRRARQGAAAPARAPESASAVDAMWSTGTSGGQTADSTASARRALLVRPQPGAVVLPRVDAVVLRQAAPFVAVGAVLLFLLLLL